MKPETIRTSFQATGVWPMDAEPVLKRFNNNTSERDRDSELAYSSGSHMPPQLVNLSQDSVVNGAKERTEKLPRRVEAL
ncbi:hypothetical protein KJE20_14089 [Pyrenophora tritici-repentis]|nr:hypothetical protein KJE20_14089 [Pyrenophora tritici-repentis]